MLSSQPHATTRDLAQLRNGHKIMLYNNTGGFLSDNLHGTMDNLHEVMLAAIGGNKKEEDEDKEMDNHSTKKAVPRS